MHRAMEMFCGHLNLDSKLIILSNIAAVFAPQGGAAPFFKECDKTGNILAPKYHMFINLINLSTQSPLEIMAHEMIHISQMFHNRLQYRVPAGIKLEVSFMGNIGLMVPAGFPVMLWEGQDWTHAWEEVKIRRCHETYRSLPWEKEAFDLQTEVANMLTFVELQELEELARA